LGATGKANDGSVVTGPPWTPEKKKAFNVKGEQKTPKGKRKDKPTTGLKLSLAKTRICANHTGGVERKEEGEPTNGNVVIKEGGGIHLRRDQGGTDSSFGTRDDNRAQTGFSW